MAKRIVIEGADRCPFCGCEKIFLKAFSQGVGSKWYSVSMQCAKCHVNGPQVNSDAFRDLPSFDKLDEQIREDLIERALVKWNTRFIGNTI